MSQYEESQNSADGSEVILAGTRDVNDPGERWDALRKMLDGKPMSCHDCRAVRDALLVVMDIARPPVKKADLPMPSITTRESPSASVTMRPASPPTAGSAQGREVAPGVVMVPAPENQEPPPNVKIIPPTPSV